MSSQSIFKQTLFSTLLMALVFTSYSQKNDSKDTTLEQRQNEFLKWKFGVFFHFGMSTFNNRDWSTGYEDPLIFNPSKLNCNQWIKEAKKAGANYAVLTTKHTDGWCLWDSKYTDHDITAFKNYKNGKGDIVREFVEACRKNNMHVGLYYCLPGDYSANYGNKEDAKRGYKITKEQEDLHGLPHEAKGDYEGFIEKQVTELFTQYGRIDIVFMDQYSNKYTEKYWLQLKALMHKLQPACIIVANNGQDYQVSDVVSYEYTWLKNVKGRNALPPEDNSKVSEVSDCIVDGSTWFWNEELNLKLQNPKAIVDKLKYCNAHKSNYILNVQPNRDGLIAGEYLKTLRKVGELNKE